MATEVQAKFRLEDYEPYAESQRTLAALRAKRKAADVERQRLVTEGQTAEQAAIDAEVAEIAQEAPANSAKPARAKAEETARKVTAAQIYVARLDHAVEQLEAKAAEERKAAQERLRQIIRTAHEKIITRIATILRELAAVELEEQALREAGRANLDGHLGNIHPPDSFLVDRADSDERDPNSRLSLWLRQMRNQGYPVD
jgi:hypothetical protein